MAENYLITGYWGEPHVTAENERGINAGIVGPGRFVLPVGRQFQAEYIGNKTIRMYDGKLLDNGAAAGIPAGRYIDLFIPEASQGKQRIDLIVFQYSKDPATLIETGSFVVVSGVESATSPKEPGLMQSDLLTNEATYDQMPLWRVSVDGAVISEPVRRYEPSPALNGFSQELFGLMEQMSERLRPLYGTEDLEPGVSELAEGRLYFVYE